MKYLVYTVFILLLLALNMQAESLFFGSGLKLNLLVLPVVFAAVELPDKTYMFFVFVCGLALDFYSSSPFGSFLFSFILVGAFLNWIAKTFLANELNFKSVFVFSGATILISGVLSAVFAGILPGSFPVTLLSFKLLTLKIFSNSVFGLLATLPVFVLWRQVLRFIAKAESKKIILGN